MRPEKTIYFYQQPEVHLHPSSQAALGSLFSRLAKVQGKQFIIETHSDYIIDRAIIEVKNKTKDCIGADDFLILYFEWEKNDVNIFPIKIDNNGNLLGAPVGYRKFFMKEKARYLGI
jgi:predicted ATPase